MAIVWGVDLATVPTYQLIGKLIAYAKDMQNAYLAADKAKGAPAKAVAYFISAKAFNDTVLEFNSRADAEAYLPEGQTITVFIATVLGYIG
jgi:cytochrome c oxidase assembly protein Cox11